MARSINGNLLGRAAATELSDLRETDWSKYPEANYWRNGALWAEAQVYNTLDGCGVEDRIEKILARFWHRKNTWMKICLRAEHMLDLIKVLVNTDGDIPESFGTHQYHDIG